MTQVTAIRPASNATDTEDQRFRAAFEASLEDLPPLQARAFRLREVAGLEVASVCREMGIAPSELLELLHRARQQLCRALGRDWFPGAP